MTRARLIRRLSAVALAAAGLVGSTAGSAGAVDPLASARQATASYHDINVAVGDGFGELRDKDGIACIDNPAGGMGVHYVLGSRVGDPAETASEPEVLVYEPMKNGEMRLVALEYVVLQSSWEGAGNTEPPSLFGQTFELVPAGNRFDLPPFYALHAWVWRDNPSGIFADWNPKVSCANA